MSIYTWVGFFKQILTLEQTTHKSAKPGIKCPAVNGQPFESCYTLKPLGEAFKNIDMGLRPEYYDLFHLQCTTSES